MILLSCTSRKSTAEVDYSLPILINCNEEEVDLKKIESSFAEVCMLLYDPFSNDYLLDRNLTLLDVLECSTNEISKTNVFRLSIKGFYENLYSLLGKKCKIH